MYIKTKGPKSKRFCEVSDLSYKYCSPWGGIDSPTWSTGAARCQVAPWLVFRHLGVVEPALEWPGVALGMLKATPSIASQWLNLTKKE